MNPAQLRELLGILREARVTTAQLTGLAGGASIMVQMAPDAEYVDMVPGGWKGPVGLDVMPTEDTSPRTGEQE